MIVPAAIYFGIEDFISVVPFHPQGAGDVHQVPFILPPDFNMQRNIYAHSSFSLL